ncbi:hypothetical protein ACRALDRAFT_2017265, partial [Sodiomyces alcalophilus JCM 7366]|uniref:uncharacterized protein n=1 Tax=Sodiomyces alcalophilus JCM 7366 TaxID=591952 RepID=UPI0039B65590
MAKSHARGNLGRDSGWPSPPHVTHIHWRGEEWAEKRLLHYFLCLATVFVSSQGEENTCTFSEMYVVCMRLPSIPRQTSGPVSLQCAFLPLFATAERCPKAKQRLDAATPGQIYPSDYNVHTKYSVHRCQQKPDMLGTYEVYRVRNTPVSRCIPPPVNWPFLHVCPSARFLDFVRNALFLKECNNMQEFKGQGHSRQRAECICGASQNLRMPLKDGMDESPDRCSIWSLPPASSSSLLFFPSSSPFRSRFWVRPSWTIPTAYLRWNAALPNPLLKRHLEHDRYGMACKPSQTDLQAYPNKTQKRTNKARGICRPELAHLMLAGRLTALRPAVALSLLERGSSQASNASSLIRPFDRINARNQRKTHDLVWILRCGLRLHACAGCDEQTTWETTSRALSKKFCRVTRFVLPGSKRVIAKVEVYKARLVLDDISRLFPDDIMAQRSMAPQSCRVSRGLV